MWLEQYKLSAEKDQKLKEALEKSYGKRIDWSGTVTETLRLRKEPGRRMYESSADFLKMLRDIQAYSPLRLYTTEDERLQEILQDLDIIRKRNELRETSGQRDEMVYRTVERTAGTKSILFMGINHELVDFYRADSGFAVACARLDTTGLEYRHANRDSIPAFFREIVERRYAEVVR